MTLPTLTVDAIALSRTLVGIQDQQKTIDKFYADYDVVFPKKSKSVARFHNVLNALTTIIDTIRDTRFSNKSDFYGLFAAVNELDGVGKNLDLSPAAKELTRLSTALEDPPETLKGIAQEYYATLAEGANKLAKREKRMELLKGILESKI